MYILPSANDQYYTGSTNNLIRRIAERESGVDANFTKNNLPLKLVYVKEFERVQDAFKKEKQVQGWSRAKKEALVGKDFDALHKLAECQNESHFKNIKAK
ncbi:MAG: GIY-YIG nuclease family protein [Bacteroidia bacterium]